MKVRVRQHPSGYWMVEQTKWWWPEWMIVETFVHDKAKERALDYAQAFLNPETIEVKKEKK